jgi:hypothetical protein
MRSLAIELLERIDAANSSEQKPSDDEPAATATAAATA